MTGSDDKKTVETNDDPPIPEVEAEIVSEEAADHESGTLFHDAESDTCLAGDETNTTSQTDAFTQDKKSSRPQKMGAMIMAGLLATGIIAGGAWYFINGKKTAPVTAPSQNIAQTPSAEALAEALDTERTEVSKAPLLQAESDQPIPFETAALPAAPERDEQQLSDDNSEEASVERDGAELDSPFEEKDTAEAREATDETASENISSVGIQISQEQSDPDQQADIDLAETVPTEENFQASNDKNSANTPDPELLTAEQEKLAMLEAAFADEQSRTSSLETELATIRAQYETALGDVQLASDRIEQAQQQIAGLRRENTELRERAENSPVAAGALAINAITRAIATGEPYGRDLEALKAAAPGTPEVDLLAVYADGTAPLTSDIQRAFRDTIRDGLSAARKSEATSVWDRYSARAVNVINLRPSTPQPGSSPEAIISRAEFAVANDDLQAAIDELSAMPGPAREAMSDWIILAEKRIAIDAALASLNASIASETNG